MFNYYFLNFIMDGRAQVALGRVSTTENETIQLLA